MSDRDISNWEKRLTDQVLRDWHNYNRYRIDLSTVHDAEFWGYAGEFMVVEEVSSASAAASIRLNRNTNDAIDLNAGTIIKTVFKEFYITNIAQPDEWIDIVIGINFEYYKRYITGESKLEAQPVLILTHAAANTNAVAAAHDCRKALIKADINNVQAAWIDFGTAAVQNNCFPLDTGEWVRVSILNTNQINANFEIGDEKVFIIYEL